MKYQIVKVGKITWDELQKLKKLLPDGFRVINDIDGNIFISKDNDYDIFDIQKLLKEIFSDGLICVKDTDIN